jgi:hypothetical protein
LLVAAVKRAPAEATARTSQPASEPVGIGASWRAGFCMPVHGIPAREIRTYRLASVSRGFVTLSFRHAVTLDPGRTSLGTAKDGDRMLHYRLLTLGGTGSGTLTLSETSPLASTSTGLTLDEDLLISQDAQV